MLQEFQEFSCRPAGLWAQLLAPPTARSSRLKHRAACNHRPDDNLHADGVPRARPAQGTLGAKGRGVPCGPVHLEIAAICLENVRVGML